MYWERLAECFCIPFQGNDIFLLKIKNEKRGYIL